MGVYGLHWTQLSHWYRYRGTAVLLWHFTVLLRYFNLILKAVKESSEPERGAEAHEVRRSAEYVIKFLGIVFCKMHYLHSIGGLAIR